MGGQGQVGRLEGRTESSSFLYGCSSAGRRRPEGCSSATALRAVVRQYRPYTSAVNALLTNTVKDHEYRWLHKGCKGTDEIKTKGDAGIGKESGKAGQGKDRSSSLSHFLSLARACADLLPLGVGDSSALFEDFTQLHCRRRRRRRRRHRRRRRRRRRISRRHRRFGVSFYLATRRKHRRSQP